METPNHEASSSFSRKFIKAKFDKMKTDVGDVKKLTKQLAKEDPKRIVHSLKVAFAITLVSLFYYFKPFYEGFGNDAMWAVLTVVVVFEFSVGATLGKGVNRVVATVLGGTSAVGAHILLSLPEELLPLLEPILLGLSVFLTAGVMTYIRFFPKMKARFDYGLVIFILTFSLISVSGYRDDEIIDIATRRVTTIVIGSIAAVIVCVMICPVWAGADLHTLVATNLETLANFYQEFGVVYFKTSLDATSTDRNKVALDSLIKVLDSKNTVDSLLNLARWEPRHGQFKYGHPWTQYQKIGELTRHCCYRTYVLHGFLLAKIQAPVEVKAQFHEACVTMSLESGKALNDLSLAMMKMNQPSKEKRHVQNAKQAAEDLNLLLASNTWNKDLNLSDVTPTATVATLLVEVVACTEKISEAILELASLAKFKDVNVIKDGKVAGGTDATNKLANQGSFKTSNHIITIHDEESSPICSPKKSASDPPSLSMAQQNAE